MPPPKERRLLAAALSHALRVPGDAPFLLQRSSSAPSSPYAPIPYSEVADAAAELAAGLRGAGVAARSCVGIASENRPEWLETDFACAFGDYMNVGLHPGWPADKLAHIMHSAEVLVVVASVSGALSVAAAVAELRGSFPGTPEPLVVLLPRAAGDADESVQAARAALPSALQWDAVRRMGRAPDARTHTGYGFADDVSSPDPQRAPLVVSPPPHSHDSVTLSNNPAALDEGLPYTLMFSSGSGGGPPKATVNTKRDWLTSNCAAGAFANFDEAKDRRGVSYLSLCHGADRGICWQAAFGGGTVGFARGEADLDGCLADLAELRPTFFLGFAPFWTALYQRHIARLLPRVDEALAAQLRAEASAGSGVGEASPKSSEGGESAVAAAGAAAASFSEYRESHPVEWQALRDAFLATRKGGALLRRTLDETRSAVGGCLRSAATGGSRTPAAVRRFMFFLLEEGSNGVTDSCVVGGCVRACGRERACVRACVGERASRRSPLTHHHHPPPPPTTTPITASTQVRLHGVSGHLQQRRGGAGRGAEAGDVPRRVLPRRPPAPARRDRGAAAGRLAHVVLEEPGPHRVRLGR
jgi:long-subunit acyl-CoA synthetase (AMP-forming)